jgi:hypothetical protein
MHFGRWASAGFLCGLGLAACKTSELNSEHCANNEGDATCLSRYPDGSRPFCGRGSCFTEVEDGCVTDRPSEDSCASPCGNQTYADEPDGLDCVDGGTATAGDDDGGMTTGPTGDGPGTVGPDTDTDPSGMTEGPTDGSGTATDDGPMGCTSDDECTEADAPFCVEMICSACSATDDPDAACAEKFPETPACSASMCVQCAAGVTGACMGETPICDTDANTCVACTAHDQCDGDAACDIETGACFPADAVFWEDGNAACPGMGTMAMPWCELQSHIDDLPVAGMMTVHLVSGTGNDENLFVDSGKRIALLGDVTDKAIFQPPVGNSTNTLEIDSATSAVYLDGTRFTANVAQPALRVSGGALYVHRSEIVANTEGGILATDMAHLDIENCFVGNGGNASAPLRVDGSTAEIVYSTLAAGFDEIDPVYAIECSGTDAGDVAIRNILVFSSDDPASRVLCAGAEVMYSASVQQIPGTGNVALGPIAGTWFDDFGAGDFHLDAPPAALATTAQWQSGDPITDIDGAPRQATVGAMGYAGADLP